MRGGPWTRAEVLARIAISTNRPVEVPFAAFAAKDTVLNQLTPSETVTAIGVTVRTAARGDAQTSDFEPDQMMSAYSATRHLADRARHVRARAAQARLPGRGRPVGGRLSGASPRRGPGIHVHLRALADREVALLADALGQPVEREGVRTFSVLGIMMLLSTHYMGIWMYANGRSTDFRLAWNRFGAIGLRQDLTSLMHW